MAKDKSSLVQVQKELEMKCSSFESHSLELMYEKLPQVWSDMFKGELEFSDKDILPIVSSILIKNKPSSPSDIKQSPFFKRVFEEFPRMDPNVLEKYSSIMPPVEAGIKTLTLDFIQNRPVELDHTDEYAEWKDIYINHLHEYKENWKNKLKEIYNSTEKEQKLWEKGSTSLPTTSQ